MKTLIDLGVLKVIQNGDELLIQIDGSADLGGGAAAGIVHAEGSAKVVLKEKQAFDLGCALVEAKVPSFVKPIIEAGEAIGDAIIDSQAKPE